MSEKPEAQSERRCCIALCEDYDLLAQIRARYLRGLGVTVYTYRDAETAIRGIATIRPDVVVADYWLPGLDGIALLEEASRQIPGVGRVLISGQIPDHAREWADREGVPIVLKGEDQPDVLPRAILRECRRRGA